MLNDIIRRNLTLACTQPFAYHAVSPAYHPCQLLG